MREEAFSPDPPRKRNSCKAIVFDGETVLLTRNRDRRGDFYLLPGGGQRLGETLHEAVRRETAEETGWLVEPGRLLLVRDYIGARHEFAAEDADVHQVELMFAAGLDGRVEGWKPVRDAWQTGVEWLPLARLDGIRIYPSMLSELLPELAAGTYHGAVYLGDVN
jgi:ADP-ribose pyrophosphatase YjhB (NUDIX family)